MTTKYVVSFATCRRRHRHGWSCFGGTHSKTFRSEDKATAYYQRMRELTGWASMSVAPPMHWTDWLFSIPFGLFLLSPLILLAAGIAHFALGWF